MKEKKPVSSNNKVRLAPLNFCGTAISPGFSQGITHILHSLLGPIDAPPQSDELNVDEEISRLDQATVHISDELLALATRVEKEIDVRLAEVFSAHKLILNDQILRDELRKEIAENLVTASGAVKSVFLRWEKRFLLMESMIAREKADDLRDISIRLSNALAGITVHPLESIPEKCVLVTSRLLPSDTMFLGGRSTAAVLLEYGSLGSHAALFTRQMGIPCISDIPNIMTRLPEGKLALVDANSGLVTINPDEAMRAVFQNKQHHYEQIINTSRMHASKPAVTKEGCIIKVNANVGCYEDACKAIENGADGIGLYRLEQFYIGRTQPPSFEELLTEIRHTLTPFKRKHACVRLLDVGSDKPLPFIGFLAETNPALGRRGIRVMREYPALLRTQIMALLALRDEFQIQILVPMVAMPEDVKFVRDMLVKQCNELGISAPQLGAMIETPAAALSAHGLAPYVDFISFGTNDLTQYVFAADRENAAVEIYFNDSSEAIFRLIEMVHNDLPEMPLSVCGELAGRQEHVAKLLQCGIRSLSVAAPLVATIKENIRNIKLKGISTHQQNGFS
ncbi:phosphoenolpyruvate--protein phosphotransferase [Aestuariirhabdus sp. Z084]|uniref:phosphoenolpyruvate--protein phosphotransferase n=1 Tax=Aestuariirhabdus haliotis TaxID=2918751 RepID=UPI0020C146EA|nr:phosphoenolpyruvate--protein phosphotransferase [Aestuariirhabdus haliotis]MCL6417262.1 phosphoenolpyruvate--protein phosphotransferase [Aestuariirhabdus haliotis]